MKKTLANAQTGKTGDQQNARSSEATMPHHELGATGATIPILILGTSQRLDPVYDKIMHRCFKGGVTAVDTALSYGWGASHRAVANFVSQIGDRKKRLDHIQIRQSRYSRFVIRN